MPRKKQNDQQGPNWNPEKPATIIHEFDPEDDEIDRVFAALPQNDLCLELFRVNAQGGRPLFLESITPGLFSLSYVTEKFGGGKYFVRSTYKDGTPVRMPFEIEGDPFPVKRTPVAPAPVSSGQPASSASPIPLVFPETERGSGQDAMVALMRTLVTELRTSKQSMLEEIKLYKELFAPVAQPATPVEQALSLFQKGLEMAEKRAGGESNPWLYVISELKEPISKMLDTVQVAMSKPTMTAAPVLQPTQAMPATSSPHAGAPVQPPSSEQPAPSKETMMIQNMLKMALPILVNAAARNADPGTYVEMILDQVPESYYTQLYTWLAQEGCLEVLVKLEPGIRFQQEWWSALRAGLIESLAEALGKDLGHAHADLSREPQTHSDPSGSGSSPGDPVA